MKLKHTRLVITCCLTLAVNSTAVCNSQKTTSGQKCRGWNSKYIRDFVHRTGAGPFADNKCRNIDNDPKGAWCFTAKSDKKIASKFGYCSCGGSGPETNQPGHGKNQSKEISKECNRSLWKKWVHQLDCFWNSNRWWRLRKKLGSARSTKHWKRWNSAQTKQLDAGHKSLRASEYYDVKKQAVCGLHGARTSVGKINNNTLLTSCTTGRRIGTFGEARHMDAVTSNGLQAINFATIYNDKVRQAPKEARRAGHSDWKYGDYYNYDHLPPKSIYPKRCSGGKGKRLPTVAVQAVDHKGPVWVYCTTSRSIKRDNDRHSMQKMQTYAAAGQYGRAILENFDCLLQASLKFDDGRTYTDYILGFENLVHLHHKATLINAEERETLLTYLKVGRESLANASRKFKKFDQQLEEDDSNLKPLIC